MALQRKHAGHPILSPRWLTFAFELKWGSLDERESTMAKQDTTQHEACDRAQSALDDEPQITEEERVDVMIYGAPVPRLAKGFVSSMNLIDAWIRT